MMSSLEVCSSDRFLMSLSQFLQANANYFTPVNATSLHIQSYL